MNNLLNRRRGLMGQGGDDYIHFADPEVERICLANWDSDHDGKISYAEALAVTNFGNKFAGKTNIYSFEEVKYFGIQTINASAFAGTSNLNSNMEFPYLTSIGSRAFNRSAITGFNAPLLPSIPGDEVFGYCGGLKQVMLNSIVSIGKGAFGSCSSLSNIQLGSGLEFIGENAFAGDYELKVIFDLPNLTSVSAFCLQRCGITQLIAPKLTSFPYKDCLAHTTFLSRVYLRDIESIGFGTFNGSATSVLIIDNSIPPSQSTSFSSGCQFYVPDSAVETYKADTSWSTYASRIHGISELPD